MDLTTYQDMIAKVAVYPEEVGFAYCTLGIVGELGEFMDAYEEEDKERIAKEAGDVFWYLTAITSKELGGDINDLFTFDIIEQHPGVVFIGMVKAQSRIAENIKKYYRDSKAIEIESDITLMANSLFTLLVLKGLSVENVLKKNYDKLLKRRETNTLHGDGDNREE